MRIAMIGTRGVPARYGGFETAVEEVGRRLTANGHEVTVYCRNPDQRLTSYQGMRLVNLPALRERHLETLSHTLLSVTHAVVRGRPRRRRRLQRRERTAAARAAARAVSRSRCTSTAWSGSAASGPALGARYYRWAERRSRRAGRRADRRRPGHRRPHPRRRTVASPSTSRTAPRWSRPGPTGWPPWAWTRSGYHLVVARFEPENHVTEIVDGLRGVAPRTTPLVVVGSAPYDDEYTAQVRDRGRAATRGSGSSAAIWDQDLLDQLYANALSYLHGHSVGGTNPSLLRAMGAGAPVTACDVVFNREVVNGHARYWSSPDERGPGHHR